MIPSIPLLVSKTSHPTPSAQAIGNPHFAQPAPARMDRDGIDEADILVFVVDCDLCSGLPWVTDGSRVPAPPFLCFFFPSLPLSFLTVSLTETRQNYAEVFFSL